MVERNINSSGESSGNVLYRGRYEYYCLTVSQQYMTGQQSVCLSAYIEQNRFQNTTNLNQESQGRGESN